MKCDLLKGFLSLKELGRICKIVLALIVNFAEILTEYPLPMSRYVVFTPENRAFEDSYQSTILLLLSLKGRVLLVFLTNGTC